MKTVSLNSGSNNENSKEGQIKPRYSLTQMQKDFIALQLPKGISFTLANEIDQKRQRIPKKTDDNFQTEYPKANISRNAQDRKLQKREEKKGRQKRQANKSERLQETKMNEIKNIGNGKQLGDENNGKNEQNRINNRKQVGCNDRESGKGSSLQIKRDCQQENNIGQTYNNLQFMKTRTDGHKVSTHNFIPNCELPMEFKDQPKDDGLPINRDIHPIKGLTPEQKQHYIRLVSKLKAHKSSWPFRIPVDPIPQGVPNYLKVIHEPMDLKTIEKKLVSYKYQHPAQILGDINKIFLNSYKFNPKQCQYYTLTVELEGYYHELLKSQEDRSLHDGDKIAKNKEKQQIKNEECFQDQSPQGKRKKFQSSLRGAESVIASERKIMGDQQNLSLIQKKVERSKAKAKYSDVFKKQLVKKIAKLSSKSIEVIVQIAFGKLEQQNATIELDFQKLPDEKIEKISLIVKNEIERNEESKNNLFAFETRFSLF